MSRAKPGCVQCGGSGKVPGVHQRLVACFSCFPTRKCGACRKGRVAGMDCPLCGGKGYVVRRPTMTVSRADMLYRPAPDQRSSFYHPARQEYVSFDQLTWSPVLLPDGSLRSTEYVPERNRGSSGGM